MRQIVLDTETTGLDPKLGHRIIEVAGVEFVNRRPTGRHIHFYLNPEREIDSGATDVHGLTWEMLRDKAKFADVVNEFLEFARGAEWIIHNAPFDIAFLDEELKRVNLPSVADVAADVIDTLALAREHFPGKKNNLDALCERFGVANAHRTLHGAMLDAQLLAEVYLAMTRGQESLVMELETPAQAAAAAALLQVDLSNLILLPALPEEVALHEQYLDAMEKERKAPSLWRRLLSSV